MRATSTTLPYLGLNVSQKRDGCDAWHNPVQFVTKVYGPAPGICWFMWLTKPSLTWVPHDTNSRVSECVLMASVDGVVLSTMPPIQTILILSWGWAGYKQEPGLLYLALQQPRHTSPIKQSASQMSLNCLNQNSIRPDLFLLEGWSPWLLVLQLKLTLESYTTANAKSKDPKPPVYMDNSESERGFLDGFRKE